MFNEPHVDKWDMHKKTNLKEFMQRFTLVDALPSSLIDSNVNLKRNQQKSMELGHAPWLATLWGVEGRARASIWD
jgi:hypothetical protein